MKTEFVDVNETRKNLVVEIESTVVDAEIDKVSRDYSKAARIPGFRPGTVPAKVVRQRFAASSRWIRRISRMWSSKKDSR